MFVWPRVTFTYLIQLMMNYLSWPWNPLKVRRGQGCPAHVFSVLYPHTVRLTFPDSYEAHKLPNVPKSKLMRGGKLFTHKCFSTHHPETGTQRRIRRREQKVAAHMACGCFRKVLCYTLRFSTLWFHLKTHANQETTGERWILLASPAWLCKHYRHLLVLPANCKENYPGFQLEIHQAKENHSLLHCHWSLTDQWMCLCR